MAYRQRQAYSDSLDQPQVKVKHTHPETLRFTLLSGFFTLTMAS